MLRPIALVALLTCLSGCETASSSVVCPREKEYSADFQRQLADEMDLLPLGSALALAMVDYHQLRNQTRACRKG